LSTPNPQVKLKPWLFTSLDPVSSAATISVSSARSRQAVESPNPFTVVAPNVVTKSTGHYFQVMAQSAIDKIPPGPKLDALTAERIFGWKNIQAQSFAGEVSPKSFEPDALLHGC
jgi:hypothetical protein